MFDLTDPSAVHKIRSVSEALDSLSTLEAHDVMTLVPPKELDRYILDECPRIIVGNKVDLLRERAILTEDVQVLSLSPWRMVVCADLACWHSGYGMTTMFPTMK